MPQAKLILASGSPRRRDILREMGLDYTIQVSDVDEEEIASKARPDHPEEIVTLLAEAKARKVARGTSEAALVIGADTIVWLDGRALNKPKDESDAVRMLLLLQGRAHYVYTGVAVVPAGDCLLRPAVTGYDVTEVEFHPMTEAEARAYVATEEPMDKAGAYGIQNAAIGQKFVKAVRGEFDNVVGLPKRLLLKLLAEAGY